MSKLFKNLFEFFWILEKVANLRVHLLLIFLKAPSQHFSNTVNSYII